MIKKQKAQGLSLNTIIIAALVLIVLVVLIMVFSGKIGGFRDGVSTCGGSCVASPSDCQEDETAIYLIDCKESSGGQVNGNYCCTPRAS